jgi:hypothetical protein
MKLNEQRCIGVGLLAATVGLISGCVMFHAVGESGFTVQGRIVSSALNPTSTCALELYRQESGKKLQEAAIQIEFKKTFLIAPEVRKYYMMIHCPGSIPFQSKVYELGRSGDFMRPVDLGIIELASANPVRTP